MTDENQTTARSRFSKDDWVLYVLLGLLVLVIAVEQFFGLDNAVAKLKDLFATTLMWAITGVWVALFVKLFWPWIRLWMYFVVTVAIVWFWWRVGGH